ncbi:hypothetical protein [Lewinella sp. IMCC34183]|uniref:hypothetical protein n=1 Tax=Lewinella sp. IMCC34183 TaxID=2248762 RepID=UPI0013004278|nr:hypothetical protein [Lewinella sp. IMCC34183]
MHVGRDAIYRRLRGDTSLTADEMMRLAEIYHLRTEVSSSRKKRAGALRYPDGHGIVRSEFDYFTQLHQRLEHLNQLPGASFDFASPELPMYYELATPTLRAFKIFMFGITTWNLEKWKNRNFSTDLISDSLHRLVEVTVADHYRVPARELWSVGVLDVTLRQVNYMAQVGKFADSGDLKRIFSELHQIVNHLERMVRTGKRFSLKDGPQPSSCDFRVYHNELSNTSNLVLVKSDIRPFLFTSLLTPNYVATSDPDLCAEAQVWFDNLVEHGSALHADSGKYAAQYFGYLRNLIQKYEQLAQMGQYVF